MTRRQKRLRDPSRDLGNWTADQLRGLETQRGGKTPAERRNLDRAAGVDRSALNDMSGAATARDNLRRTLGRE